jgi:hypothetical protein
LEEITMAQVLTQLLATGLWVLVVAGIGIWLDRRSRPYGRVKLWIHILLTVFVLAGFISSFVSLSGLGQPRTAATICLTVLGLALLSNVVVGIRMATSRELDSRLPRVHTVSTVVILLSIIAASISVALRV